MDEQRVREIVREELAAAGATAEQFADKVADIISKRMEEEISRTRSPFVTLSPHFQVSERPASLGAHPYLETY